MYMYERLGVNYEQFDPNPNHHLEYNDDFRMRPFVKLLNLPYKKVYKEFHKVAKERFEAVHDDSIWRSYCYKNPELDYIWLLNQEDESMSMGSIIDEIRGFDIRCILVGKEVSTYYEDNTIYDKFALLGKTVDVEVDHEILHDYVELDCACTKASVDEHLGQLIEYVVAYKEDIEKIKTILRKE